MRQFPHLQGLSTLAAVRDSGGWSPVH